MNILLITENYFPITEPTAKVVSRLIDEGNDIHWTVLSKGFKHGFIRDGNVINVQLPNYYRIEGNLPRRIKAFCYRSIRKIYARWKPPQFLDVHRFLRVAKRLCSSSSFDAVIAVSGWFWTQEVGMRASRKYHIPFFEWYVDLFLSCNIPYPAEKLRRIEERWWTQANAVFMPQNYISHYRSAYGDISMSKIVRCELPCSLGDEEKKTIKSTPCERLILHSGEIIDRIYDYEWFFSLVQSVPEYRWESLQNPIRFQQKVEIPINFSIKPRIAGQDFIRYYAKAEVALIADNINGLCIPSKAYEALSAGKKILLIWHKEQSDTRQLLDVFPGVFKIRHGEPITTDLLMRLKSFLDDPTKHYERDLYSNKDQLQAILTPIRGLSGKN